MTEEVSRDCLFQVWQIREVMLYLQPISSAFSRYKVALPAGRVGIGECRS
jgi:hypothetical protein